MNRVITPAVVLRTVNYGDADRVVTLFTREAGKVAVMARSARKGSRRFGASGLGLFTMGTAELVLSQSGSGLDRLRRFEVGNGFSHLGLDVAKFAHASYVAELGAELGQPHQREPELFELISHMFGAIDSAPAASERLRWFEIQLLDLVGLGPELERCRACGSQSLGGAEQGFSYALGGVVCGHCQTAGVSLPEGARQALLRGRRALAQDDLTFFSPWGPTLGPILLTFFESQIGRPLRSAAFIRELNRQSAVDKTPERR